MTYCLFSCYHPTPKEMGFLAVILVKSYEETIRALDSAIKQFDNMGYPDPTRMDELKKFRRSMDNDSATDTYEVWYSQSSRRCVFNFKTLKSVKSRLNFGKIWGFETGLVPLQTKIYKW